MLQNFYLGLWKTLYLNIPSLFYLKYHPNYSFLILFFDMLLSRDFMKILKLSLPSSVSVINLFTSFIPVLVVSSAS